jgi:Zn-dependent membrane protease YugP
MDHHIRIQTSLHLRLSSLVLFFLGCLTQYRVSISLGVYLYAIWVLKQVLGFL